MSVNQEKMPSTIADPFGGIIANEAFEPVFDLHNVVVLVNVGIKSRKADHANYEEKHNDEERSSLEKGDIYCVQEDFFFLKSSFFFCHLLDKYNRITTILDARIGYHASFVIHDFCFHVFYNKISSFFMKLKKKLALSSS